ncbi:MAG TPA: hypothetical protein DEA22_12895 [Blastocatellia bacterium]|nr:hypothetical protein [Blastocatellia bacterium]
MFDHRRREISPPKLIKALGEFDLLPAIVFLPTRRKCDEAALETAADKGQRHNQERYFQRKEIFESYAAEHPEITKHKHKKILVNAGIASHHAGHIPAWKLIVEKMMSAGLLNAIFATSTVAAGVDFPARTVVISNADTRGNEGWRPLRVSELQQMTGRAGRRGKDNVGFVVLAPGQFQNPRRILELLKSLPEPLESKFRATYTSLLNLLDAFGNFEQVREIAERSFSFKTAAKQISDLGGRFDAIYDEISAEIAAKGLALTVDDVRGFERLMATRTRLEIPPYDAIAEDRAIWLREKVSPGRIVRLAGGGKRLFVVLGVHKYNLEVMRDDGAGRRFPLSKIKEIYAKRYLFETDALDQAFADVIEGRNPPLSEPAFEKLLPSKAALSLIDSLIEKLISSEGDRAAAREFLWSISPRANHLADISADIEYLRTGIWLPFLARAKVLDHFGYIDYRSEKVNDEGKWLADVRVDRPLLVGEALRFGLFANISPSDAAGLAAALAADSDRDYGRLATSERLDAVIAKFEGLIMGVMNVEFRFGVDSNGDLNLSASAAAEKWATGASWNELAAKTGAEEGDLFRLLSRTGEVLIQIAQLKESNPAAAAIAREAAELVLRDPVR